MIRELNESELEALLDLYSYLHEHDDALPDRDSVAKVWDAIQQAPNLKYFGAFVDEALVSCCTLSVIPNLTRGCRPYGVIENVVTDPEFRRRGLGRSVLEYALA
jgi:ribosomal protein S18 acetylase RimI-like enzyme